MSNSLFGGRHNAVVGSNNDDGDIRYLSTTGTHSREGLVARGIEERDAMTILQLHIVSTDVLSDTTSLTSNDVGIADMVKQRSFTVVDMTHHRYNRSTADQIVLIILLLSNGILHFS